MYFGTRPRSSRPRLPRPRRPLRMEPLEDRRMLSVLFVDTDAAEGGDGLAWGTAFDDLQPAFESASVLNADADAGNDIDAIWIAEGVYKPSAELEPGDVRSASFSLVDGVTLYGGFVGSETSLEQRNLETHETVLSGDIGNPEDWSDNAYTVVYCANEVDAAIDAVTVTGGAATGPYSSSDTARAGGGVFNEGRLRITNTRFGQSFADQGSTIFNLGGTLDLLNSTVRDGLLGYHGYAEVANDGGTLNIVNTTICGLSMASSVVAVVNTGGQMSVIDSTIWIDGSSPAAGIYNCLPGTVELTNSIVFGSGDSSLVGEISLGGGNLIGIDPQFVRNPGTDGPDDYGDLRLTSGSPAIDIGDASLLPADGWDLDADDETTEPLPIDLAGDVRVFGEALDAGAYEYQSPLDPGRETPATEVTTSFDIFNLYDGYTSLREAAYYVGVGTVDAPITFAESLAGFTFTLDGSSILIDAGMTIDGSSMPGGVTIDADESSRVFTVMTKPSQPVELIGLNLRGGKATNGGGVYNERGTLRIRDCRLSDNTATNQGGAVSNVAGVVSVTNSTVLGNRSGDDGGAFYNRGTLYITNSTVAGNETKYSTSTGGAVRNMGELVVTNSVFAGNSAPGERSSGGAIYNWGGNFHSMNSTFSGNSAVESGGIYCTNNSNGITLINSILSGNPGGDLVGSLSDKSVNNLLAVDPGFVRDPGTEGEDDYGDLRLTAQSTAIDAGNYFLLPPDSADVDRDGDTTEVLPVDLAGNARKYGQSVDIGAYEFIATAAIPGDLNGDGMVGGPDLDIIRANWGQSVVAGSLFDGDPSGDGTVGGADLDIVRSNWGQTAAAASAVTSMATPAEEDATEDAVYGPARKNEGASTRHQNLHTLADAAWANAVTALQTRAASREARAVDRVMLDWDLVGL